MWDASSSFLHELKPRHWGLTDTFKKCIAVVQALKDKSLWSVIREGLLDFLRYFFGLSRFNKVNHMRFFIQTSYSSMRIGHILHTFTVLHSIWTENRRWVYWPSSAEMWTRCCPHFELWYPPQTCSSWLRTRGGLLLTWQGQATITLRHSHRCARCNFQSIMSPHVFEETYICSGLFSGGRQQWTDSLQCRMTHRIYIALWR